MPYTNYSPAKVKKETNEENTSKSVADESVGKDTSVAEEKTSTESKSNVKENTNVSTKIK